MGVGGLPFSSLKPVKQKVGLGVKFTAGCLVLSCCQLSFCCCCRGPDIAFLTAQCEGGFFILTFGFCFKVRLKVLIKEN